MKHALFALLLVFDAAEPTTHFRYQRWVQATGTGQNCLILDAAVLAHAAASLADLRLYTAGNGHEVPYVLTESGSGVADNVPARVTNLHHKGRELTFDLVMPARPYTDVLLDLHATDFVATAAVSAGAQNQRSLGSFTLFDRSADRLPRSTALHLQETTEPLLHVVLRQVSGSVALTPATLGEVTVPPSREAQTLFTPVLSTSLVEQTGSTTRASFAVPAHLPIERVRIVLSTKETRNFTRKVRVSSHLAGEAAGPAEQISGTIGRIHGERSGLALNVDQLTVPATLGANLQQPATVQVSIENGSETPLALASIALETRQRQLCFVPQSTPSLLLFYGDRKLEAAQYSLARHFHPDYSPGLALLGPEAWNPRYTPREDARPLIRRHPRLLSLGTILLVCLLALPLLRSKKLRL